MSKLTPTRPARTASLFTPLRNNEEYIRVLMYGREGSGKTTSALRASTGGKTLIIDAEGGLKQKALSAQGVDVDNVVVFTPPNGEPLTHSHLNAAYRQVQADLAKDPDSWYAVVIDSASDIVTSMVHYVSDDRVTKARERGVEIDDVDKFFTDRSDYGTMAKMFRDILRKFRDLPCHLVITALERRDVDEDTGAVMYGPAVSPALVTDLTGYMDLVLACQSANEDGKPFRAATSKTKRYRAKDRLGVLPAVLVDPFFDRIAQYVDGTLTPDTDPVQAKINNNN